MSTDRPRTVVDAVGFASHGSRRYSATNNMTGEKHENLTQTALTKVTKGAVEHARSKGLNVDQFGRVPAGTKFPGES